MIGFAIIGCGHIAKKHARAIEESEQARLVGVYDIDAENAKSYQAKIYDSYALALQDPAVQVVNLCVPSGLHKEYTLLAAQAKKHVIVEKPMALNYSDAQEMIIACEKENTLLSVVYPNRFYPAIQYLKQAIDEKKFGKITHCNVTLRWNRNQDYYDQAKWRGTWQQDGGVLMNQAIHYLDLMTWLLGDVKKACSYSAKRLRDIETGDVWVGITEFDEGMLGVIEAAVTIYPQNLEDSINVFGEKGSVKIKGLAIEHWRMDGYSNAKIEEMKHNLLPPLFGHRLIIEDMIQSICENRQPILSGLEGIRSIKLASQLIDSARRNGE